MKLRNKKTGEIKPAEAREDGIYLYNEITKQWYKYELDLLAKWWEYYEEPKGYWYIDWTPEIGAYHTRDTGSDADERQKEIGNYFETKEEAEKVVEKLKAWKRLKEAGFIINSWNGNLCGGDHYDCCGQVNITAEVGDEDKRDTVKSDLDLLFSGEDD